MEEPTRAEVDAFTVPTVLEFGATWCGYCLAAQTDIAAVLKSHPAVRHIYLVGGAEQGRVVRPGNSAEIAAIFTTHRAPAE